MCFRREKSRRIRAESRKVARLVNSTRRKAIVATLTHGIRTLLREYEYSAMELVLSAGYARVSPVSDWDVQLRSAALGACHQSKAT